jgi:hypothetical protein
LKTFEFTRGRLASALVAFVLVACGGGGGADSAPPTVTAADDNISLAWNTATTLAVTDNDHTSGGELTVSSVGTPTHGEARIDGGKIVYTPASGYFGTDTLTYTVTGSQGGQSASASATVHLDITASLQLSGTVVDGPIPNASVDVTVGSQHWTTTADAQGHYELTVQSDDPSAFVTIDAAGTGNQSFVKLRTLAGSLLALAGASTQGQLDSSQQPALDITHISTALATLSTQANGGGAPATDAQLASAQSRIDPDAWADMAAVIKTVVDGGMPLPAGTADTLALVSDGTAYGSFLKAIDVQQSSDQFGAVRSGVLAAMAGGAPAFLSGGAQQTVVLYSKPWSPNTAYLIQLNSAGQVSVTGDLPQVQATLTRDGDGLTLAFSPQQPIESYVGNDSDLDPVTQQQDTIRVDTVALKLQRAGASSAVVVTPTVTRTYLDGSRAGQTVTDPSSGVPFLMQAADYAKRLPLDPTEFQAGARWAGFVPASSVVSVAGSPEQDVFDLGSATSAHALFDGRDYAVSLADNVLSLNGGGKQRDYVRLSSAAANGLEDWLAIERDTSGNPRSVMYVAVLHAAASSFDWTASDAAHVWQLYETADDTWVYRLNADGSAEWDYWALGGSSIDTSLHWQFGADRSITITRAVGAGTPTGRTQLRAWLPLQRMNGAVCMLQTLSEVPNDPAVPTSIDYRRVGCVTDQGATSP